LNSTIDRLHMMLHKCLSGPQGTHGELDPILIFTSCSWVAPCCYRYEL